MRGVKSVDSQSGLVPTTKIGSKGLEPQLNQLDQEIGRYDQKVEQNRDLIPTAPAVSPQAEMKDSRRRNQEQEPSPTFGASSKPANKATPSIVKVGRE